MFDEAEVCCLQMGVRCDNEKLISGEVVHFLFQWMVLL